eukprot:3970282-Amphidinium_carterae.1
MGVAATQQDSESKGKGKGGGKRANKSDGWDCKHCDFYNFGYRPLCFKCKEQKPPKKDPPGVPARNPKPASSLEQALRKQIVIADSKDMPALQQHLQAALAAAAQEHKRETLPVKDQRAHLLGQARTLADKMDQQNKILQEASQTESQ